MGMGEPLLNYANVLDSIDRITAPDGLNMAPRRITRQHGRHCQDD